jgi:hypothetical protein
MKFCSECGARLPQPLGRFCSECGNPLGSTEPRADDMSGHREEMRALIARGWDLLDAGAFEQAQLTFRQAADQGWIGGVLALGTLYENQGRVAEAYETAERAFQMADESEPSDEILLFKTGAALDAARRSAMLLNDAADSTLTQIQQGAFETADASWRDVGVLQVKFAAYIKFLVSTDDIDAEMALLGAELGAQRFKFQGASESGGPNYGRMLECLAFLAQHGSATQQSQAIEEVRWWFDRWGDGLPISVVTYEPVAWVIEELRPRTG